MIRCCGNLNPELTSAARTRSATRAPRRREARPARSRKPAANVDLDLDLARLDAEERERAGASEHGPKLGTVGAHGGAPDVPDLGDARLTIGAPRARVPRVASAPCRRPARRLGRAAEALVAERSNARGMRIVARNARTSSVRGELDLIATRRRVRSSSSRSRRERWGPRTPGPSGPVLAVGHRKRHKLRSLALAWLRDRDGSVPRHAALRFDVVGIRIDARGPGRRVGAPPRSVLRRFSERRRPSRARAGCRRSTGTSGGEGPRGRAR